MAWSPSCQLLSGGHDGRVAVWDIPSGTIVGEYHWEIGPIQHLAVAPNGMTAAALGKGVAIWDLD